jgi:Zn-dependent M28 family amino/carboxypeptidase
MAAMHFRAVITVAVLVAMFTVAPLAFVTQPFVSTLPSQPPEVDPERLKAHVRRLSVDLYPRSYDRLKNINSAARYIYDEFKATGAEVTFQDVVVQESTYRNVIARFGPQSGPLLIIGAHYDSYGDTETDSGARGYSLATHTPGADDNASGVAGLIELSRLLGRNQQTRPIELVAYTLEEPPNFGTEHMGSVWHARSLAKAKRDVRLMLSLEMIGYFSDKPGSQRYPVPGMSHLYSDRGDFITLVGKFSDFNAIRKAKALMMGATNLPVYSINAPPLLQGIDFSDHRSYWHEGFAALMVTDTAFFRNGNYHESGDTYEKLDYRRMAKVVQSVYAVVQDF